MLAAWKFSASLASTVLRTVALISADTRDALRTTICSNSLRIFEVEMRVGLHRRAQDLGDETEDAFALPGTRTLKRCPHARSAPLPSSVGVVTTRLAPAANRSGAPSNAAHFPARSPGSATQSRQSD